MLVAAVNPCPCGYYPNRNKCRCSEMQIKNYIGKLSGPILDRIDICVQTEPLEYDNLKSNKINNESSEEMRKKIGIARGKQAKRFAGTNIRFNSEMTVNEIKQYCVIDKKDEAFLEKAFKNFNLSARSYHKILRVARTIADLDNSENILKKHLLEALNYRIGNIYNQ